MLLQPSHALVKPLSLLRRIFIPRALLSELQQLRQNLVVTIPQVCRMVESVVGFALRELVAEGFDEGFSQTYALLVDEKPGAVFCGTMWCAVIL